MATKHKDDEQGPLVGIQVEKFRFESAPHGLYLTADHTDPAHHVSDGAVVCYLALCYLGADSNFKVRQMRLGEVLGGRSESTVKRYLRELIRNGWVLSGPTKRVDGSQSSNRYMILREPLTSKDDPRIALYREQMAQW